MAWTAVAGWYLFASLVTLAAFGWDKRQARRGGWRTRERTLHTLELLGGWPGGLAGQQLFGHKRRKGGYQLAFWLVVALHAAGWSVVGYFR